MQKKGYGAHGRGRREIGVGARSGGRWTDRLLASVVLSAVAVFCVGAAEPSAEAFIRSRTRSCRPVFWPQGCLYIQPDSELLGSDLDPALVENAIQNGITAWNDHLGASSFLRLRYLPPRGPQEINPLDGLQLIKFRRNRFCRPPTATNSMEVCFDQSATAVTTVTFINRPSDPATDGLIVDADIDFNAVDFHFFDADSGPPPLGGRTPVDLWNTVTHELGHVMGLEHPCSLFPGAVAACAVDAQGSPAPLCTQVESERFRDPRLQTLYEATMYPTAAAGEVTKRQPHADDVAGIITAYPLVSDPRICRLPTVVQYAGCAAAASAPPGAGTALSLTGALLGAILLRRRARRRRALSGGDACP